MNIFENHPNLEKCFSTSDGEHFYNENDAKNHAKSLEDKTVEPVYNAAFLADATISNLSEEDLRQKHLRNLKKWIRNLRTRS